MHMLAKRTAALLIPAALFATFAQSSAHADTRICVGTYRIQAANGNYVAAETGRSTYEGMLRARTPAGSVGAWEQFIVRQWRNDASGIISYSFQAHNGKYVDTWASYSGSLKGMLRASAGTDNNNDQRFYFSGEFRNGDLVGFRSGLSGVSPNWWISSEEGYTGDQWNMLRARSGSIGNWELFSFQRVNGNC
ncbi:hypothetical protein J5X84_27355 [Streptosporangiaceae bacterium NEAU-GS5]|nr:hypothetical protein [Streptosporangiaceae bacterium NEAU-GS5]